MDGVKTKVKVCLQDGWIDFYSTKSKDETIQSLSSGGPVILQSRFRESVIVNPKQIPAIEVSEL